LKRTVPGAASTDRHRDVEVGLEVENDAGVELGVENSVEREPDP